MFVKKTVNRNSNGLLLSPPKLRLYDLALDAWLSNNYKTSFSCLEIEESNYDHEDLKVFMYVTFNDLVTTLKDHHSYVRNLSLVKRQPFIYLFLGFLVAAAYKLRESFVCQIFFPAVQICIALTLR